VVCCDVLPDCVVCCDVLRVDACCVTCAVLCCALGPFGLLCVAMSWVAWDCVVFNAFRCTCDCIVSALSVRCAKCRQNWASCMLLHLLPNWTAGNTVYKFHQLCRRHSH